MNAIDAFRRLHEWSPHLPAAQLGLLHWFAAETVLSGRATVSASYSDLLGHGALPGFSQQGETWLRLNLRQLAELGVLCRGHDGQHGRTKGTYWINWSWAPDAAPAIAQAA